MLEFQYGKVFGFLFQSANLLFIPGNLAAGNILIAAHCRQRIPVAGVDAGDHPAHLAFAAADGQHMISVAVSGRRIVVPCKSGHFLQQAEQFFPAAVMFHIVIAEYKAPGHSRFRKGRHSLSDIFQIVRTVNRVPGHHHQIRLLRGKPPADLPDAAVIGLIVVCVMNIRQLHHLKSSILAEFQFSFLHLPFSFLL